MYLADNSPVGLETVFYNGNATNILQLDLEYSS